MEPVLIAVSAAASSARSLFSKKLSVAMRDTAAFGFFNLFISIAAFAVIVTAQLITGFAGISLFTAGLSFLFALGTVSAQFFLMRALTTGDVSKVSFFYSCGFIIPTLAGTFLWNESLTALNIFGIALMTAAFFLCAKKSEASQVKAGKWYIYALAAMLMSGLLGILQKFHQTSEYKSELYPFLCCSFLFCIIISAAIWLIFRKKAPDNGAKLSCRGNIASALLCGVFYGAANILNLYLSGAVPAVILFPTLNGGVIILSALAGRVVFREKIGPAAIAGIFLGIVSIILLAL